MGRRSGGHGLIFLSVAKPADLPVEQVSSLRMLVNMKTARALGIAIPGSIRLRADEVIEYGLCHRRAARLFPR